MLVIIHGWSDSHRSFRRLGKKLVEHGVAPEVKHVLLGDYVSMDDEVGFSDLAKALNAAWQREKLPTAPRSVDVIVHSTGGLVIRDWMTAYTEPETTPIRRLLMLAPANFGSPLAHKGRSFVGRMVKGFKSDKIFQTGTRILKGLELGSPYSWELAQRDLFGDTTWYGPGRILCTVLVGNTGYSGISAAANANGTDGTVRVSTANLNAEFLEMDFSTDPQKPSYEWHKSNGTTAFARLNAENHSTVALKDRGPKSSSTLPLITASLTVEDDGFAAHCTELEKLSREQRIKGADDRFTHGYQNTVVHVLDDFGDDVDDYFLETFAQNTAENRADNRRTRRLQEAVDTVHRYCDNGAYRSILYDVDLLDRATSGGSHPVFIAITAMPDIRQNKNVGYSTVGYHDIGSIRLDAKEFPAVFQPDRTLMVQLKLKRYQSEKLFAFKPLKK